MVAEIGQPATCHLNDESNIGGSELILNRSIRDDSEPPLHSQQSNNLLDRAFIEESSQSCDDNAQTTLTTLLMTNLCDEINNSME